MAPIVWFIAVMVFIGIIAEIVILTSNARKRLHEAIRRNDFPKVKALIDGGGNVNEFNASGWSPLLLAIKKDTNVEMLRYLISKGADVNARSKTEFARTPLIDAAGEATPDVITVLLEAGAEVNTQQLGTGQTPLLAALNRQNPRLDVVAALLKAGADVNAQNHLGETPLILACTRYAALGGRLDMVQGLLDQGADVNAKATNGRTALMAASKEGNRDLAELLRQHGDHE